MEINDRRRKLIVLLESLPETVGDVGGDEGQHVGISVRKKRFAWYLDDHHGDGVVAFTCKAPPGVNTALIGADPVRFFLPRYTGPRGWVGVRLDLEAVDWEQVEDLVETAYRMTAPPSLVAKLNGSRA